GGVATSALWTAGCGRRAASPGSVVVLTAHDRIHAEPVLRAFERATGIRVRARYDTEASKTTGLINAVIARNGNPGADVLWNNEPVQTATLAARGLLEPHRSIETDRFDAPHRGPDGLWTSFAARARVLVARPGRGLPLRGLADFADPRLGPQLAFARPFFGTTFTHMGMLRQVWGEKRLEDWLRSMREAGVAIVPGNGPVRDMVADGTAAGGLTDTDDAHGGRLDGADLSIRPPDASRDGIALIPNTAALLRGAPNPATGRRLIDHLLSASTERALAAGRAAQIPLARDLADVETPWDRWRGGRAMEVDFVRAGAERDALVALLRRAGMDR
ncbi:MAG: substrate-binding domain-containing protein, partial [Phycisphaerales bacterium]